jgi:thiol-disulfide isomerase/thioredoxin
MLNRLLARGATERGIRRVLGALTLATVLLIAFGADRTLLARVGFAQTTDAEQALIDRLAPKAAVRTPVAAQTSALVADGLPPTDEGMMPGFPGATKWLNGGPLTPDALKGKVVLVEFWTFECINCLNALPYVKALYAKYKDRGFTVVGVHTPEFPAERVVSNVQQQVRDLGITFPVVIDNDDKIWNAWGNEYWPALYFVDTHGRVRYHHFGEGAYDEEDRVVQKLLYEAGR